MEKDFKEKHQKLNEMFAHFIDNIHVSGFNNIPKEGTNIFLVNHNCFLDIYLIAYILNKPCISTVSSNSLFGLDEERKNKLKELLYPYPIETRANKNYKDICMEGAIKLLENGKDLIIFPEGVFDQANKISKARTGAIRILFEALDSKENKYNIVPISLSVSNITQDNIQSSEVWNNFEASITILPKFNYRDYYKNYKECTLQEEKNIILRDLMDSIMKRIALELNYEYVDEYIPLYKMDGFWFPDGEFVRFENSEEKTLYVRYKEMINSIVKKYCSKKEDTK